MSPKPYHNPENVDESRVPDGWRFLYADEAGRTQKEPCRAWIPWRSPSRFSTFSTYIGNEPFITYIVPVDA